MRVFADEPACDEQNGDENGADKGNVVEKEGNAAPKDGQGESCGPGQHHGNESHTQIDQGHDAKIQRDALLDIGKEFTRGMTRMALQAEPQHLCLEMAACGEVEIHRGHADEESAEDRGGI
mgnify:CR=1 FL=1